MALRSNESDGPSLARNSLHEEGTCADFPNYKDGGKADGIDKVIPVDLDEGSPSKLVDPLLQKERDDGIVPNDLLLQLNMLRDKLSRRNQVLEIIRRAYYRDVLIIKEELRQQDAQVALRGDVVELSSRQVRAGTSDGGLSSVPSVDLREVLPLFAPSETVLQVHPCETCGGHLELVHGESKELQAARQEMTRADKSEQHMRAMVQRLRSEAKQMEEVNEALQQRVKALTKESAFTLEQLQGARRLEREQKGIIADVRAKLQVTRDTQQKLDRLMGECNDVKQQLIQSNQDRDKLSASNDHFKEELDRVSKTLHAVEVEKAQIESDLGTNYFRLQEALKKTEQMVMDLAERDGQLHEKGVVCAEQQRALTSSKEELVSTLQRFNQTKRHLEDQLIEEERAREEMQEKNLEFRRQNKQLVRDLAKIQDQMTAMEKSSVNTDAILNTKSDCHAASQATAMRNNLLKKIEDLQYRLECALMRENDLASQLVRSTSGTIEPQSLKRVLSTWQSKTVITRQSNAVGDGARPPEASMTRTLQQKANGRVSSRSIKHKALITTIEPKLTEEVEARELLDSNEKNFEIYHREVARMLMKIKKGKTYIAQQQKVISELERSNRGLTDRLDESKFSIEELTCSMNALTMRHKQEDASVSERMEAMIRQIEEGKRDQLYEAEKSTILITFLRKVSESVHEISANKALLLELDLDAVPPDNPYGITHDSSGGIQTLEVQQRKREVRRKMLMEKAMRKFSTLCHNRAELIQVELHKMKATLERLYESLDEAENKIDSDQLHIQTLEAEASKLRIVVEMKKSDSGHMERSMKHTLMELKENTRKFEVQVEELTLLKGEHGKLEENQKRLMDQLFEKDEAWQIEIRTNEQYKQTIETLKCAIKDIEKERQTLQKQLNQIEELAEFRRRTNRSVEVSAISEMTEFGIQTDRWKPPGLILRQRNGPDRIPQRYLGKASVMINCPELDRASSPRMNNVPNLPIQEFSAFSRADGTTTETDAGYMRGFLELTVYPSAKAGGRQIKTSCSSSRPKALSRLYLSSDGVSQKYIAPSHFDQGPPHQQGFLDGRPSTVL